VRVSLEATGIYSLDPRYHPPDQAPWQGIVFLSTGKDKTGTFATLSALTTGATIAMHTVVDGMGVQRSQNTISYTVWVLPAIY
jgi:hypothetical protein